ncbi:hypothetical protein Bca4012_057520 [Brassica carinata]
MKWVLSPNQRNPNSFKQYHASRKDGGVLKSSPTRRHVSLPLHLDSHHYESTPETQLKPSFRRSTLEPGTHTPSSPELILTENLHRNYFEISPEPLNTTDELKHIPSLIFIA